MGQNQIRNEGKEPQEGKKAFHQPVKDRASAKFQSGSPMVQSPKASGTGAKGNPGRPA